MTFNVQNLFDTVDDAEKDDKAFLPIAAKESPEHIDACTEIAVESWRNECLALDWSESLLETTLAALARAIRQVDGGPDIIAFQEVENAAVVERLRSEYLAELGYQSVILIEGQDLRGIDVGFLSKLPQAGPAILHAAEFPGFAERQGDTRGILQASFALPGGGVLTGFAVHFPAPYHPREMREIAYRQLAALRDAVPDDHYVFAAGDFNTVSTEAQDSGILERLVRPHFTIAHEQACDGCRGTYYYARDDNWSFLDMILWSPARSENATWHLRTRATRIVNGAEGQRTESGAPAAFDSATRSGVSDHWPLVVEIESIQKQ
jgi:endonuclease/exonuclease/phosphatase family metal-dependent hydrolase